MQEKVLIEISKYCENCPLHEKCKENQCILFRIEQLLNKGEL